MGNTVSEENYLSLNAELNLLDENGKIQFDKDREAANQYFLQHVNQNTVFFHTLEEKLDYLVDNNYYDGNILGQYNKADIKNLFKYAYSFKYRFPTFMGAYKFYQQYALRNASGDRYLERYEDRVVMCALYLARGDKNKAEQFIEEMMTNRLQPATPTFLNAGKVRRGEHVSCFLIRVEDSMHSIGDAIKSSLELSKIGGGVGICLTNLREAGAPIKGVENQSSGIIPVMKLLEDSFSYANQLGARQGAGAVYLSCHHPDIMKMLDTKRENADEKVRIKTLSMGIMVTDKAFELARSNSDMYLFSPYDVQRVYGKPMSDISIDDEYENMVEDDRIKKYKVNARVLFQTIAEIQFESGYPYLIFEKTVNEHNPIDGRISMSNLCSEIMQINTPSIYNQHTGERETIGRDISCNLASINIAKTMTTGSIKNTVERAVQALTAVSDTTDIAAVPTIKNGNEKTHSIGIGAMNLHGFLGEQQIPYGSDEALDFTNVFFATMRYHALNESCRIAQQQGQTFHDFHKSDYAQQDHTGASKALTHYVNGIWRTTPQTPTIRELFTKHNQWCPTQQDWEQLDQKIQQHGLYNAYLMAVAPNGSISYINSATSSLHPIPARIENRKESKVGRVYYPAPGMTNDNMGFYQDAYETGYKALIDTYAVAGKHVDQGMSLTLFLPSDSTTRDVNKAHIYAWSRGREKNDKGNLALFDPETSWKSGFVKSMYYMRIRQSALEGTEVEGCVSCQI